VTGCSGRCRAFAVLARAASGPAGLNYEVSPQLIEIELDFRNLALLARIARKSGESVQQPLLVMPPAIHRKQKMAAESALG
jgi:hypothetical protein